MSEDVSAPEPQDAATDPVVETPPPRRRRRLWKWLFAILGVVVVVPALLFAIWSWVSLNWTYSEGDRAGYVQKFSSKGWICKTWEGELSMVNIPGAAQERWYFTVRDDSIARIISKDMGARVSLHYQEHRGVPASCFGETQYYVTGIRRLEP